MSTLLNTETIALEFQCKDIMSRDVVTSDDSDSDRSGSGKGPEKPEKPSKHYQICFFGSTVKGESVYLEINDFEPFFFVRMPPSVVKSAAARVQFRAWLLYPLADEESRRVKIDYEQHKTLMDYNASALSWFVKITAATLKTWRLLKDRFLNKSCIPNIYSCVTLFGDGCRNLSAADPADVESLSPDGTQVALKVYEANIDPMLRYCHIQNINPAGWMTVAAGFWDYTETAQAAVVHSARTDMSSLLPAADAPMAPYLIASWDIECNSSHGDFPLANKTYAKPLREFVELSMPSDTATLFEILSAALGSTVLSAASPKISKIYRKSTRGPAPSATELAEIAANRKLDRIIQQCLTRLCAEGTPKELRESTLEELDKALTAVCPAIAGDEIIQIGTVLYKNGAPVAKHIWVLGTCVNSEVRPPGAEVPIEVIACATELEMIKKWFQFLGTAAPDVLIGYNIFGFDSEYVYDRLRALVADEDMIPRIMAPLSLMRSRPPRLEEKFLSSSAMGDNTLKFLSSVGRLQIDLLPYIRRNHNLESYTLDNVSATFVSGSLSELSAVPGSCGDLERFRFKTKSTKGIVVGRFITLLDEENDRVVDRCEVIGVEPKALIVKIVGGSKTLYDHGAPPIRWAQVKDDVSPKDIFRLHRGSASDRAVIAKYCLQDCDLVMELFHKLEILNNSVAMANVCSVPVGFIFTRGQGIKIESLIFKECRKVDQLIVVMPSTPRGDDKEKEDVETPEGAVVDAEDSYEGAIVLDPMTGIYLDDPITANDFSSLYPSSIISENISHDTIIWVKDYDNDGNYICTREGSDRYDNIAGEQYVNVEFDILRVDPSDTRKNPTKIHDGRRIARYIQQPQGTIPRILMMLLANRKKTRKAAETETDEFRKALLDAQQLAYKLTANSLYGQLGSGTFKIRRQVLAASTTGYGRKQLMYAKAVMEKVYGGGVDPRCNLECVYGDTDSIFLRFRPRNPVTGAKLTGREALESAKALTIESGKLVSSCLKAPHDFEFDKIFKSFILLSKKRYVGYMSEDGLEDDDFHRKSMGIVMKRRDNAPIVKYVYGNAIERILHCTDTVKGVKDAAAFVTSACQDLLDGKFGLHKLTITKSLRANYADPTRIAHKVLADRIATRDPGNKPSTSDRIPFVYIKTAAGAPEPKLQGDRIELPSYIVANKLTPDYAFYITNQIAKPVAQVFGLAVEAFADPRAVGVAAKAKDPVAAREALAQSILFDTILTEAARTPEALAAKGQKSIASMFAPASKVATQKKK